MRTEDDIVIRRGLWNRFIDWIIPPTAYELEQREVLLQVARRLKLRNDQLERRLNADDFLHEQFDSAPTEKKILVASWELGLTLNGNNCTAKIDLSMKGLKRCAELVAVREKDGTIPGKRHWPTVEQFLKEQTPWTMYIQPWLDGTLSIKQVRKHNPRNFTFPAT